MRSIQLLLLSSCLLFWCAHVSAQDGDFCFTDVGEGFCRGPGGSRPVEQDTECRGIATACTLESCEQLCRDKLGCMGIEFSQNRTDNLNRNGRCELSLTPPTESTSVPGVRCRSFGHRSNSCTSALEPDFCSAFLGQGVCTSSFSSIVSFICSSQEPCSRFQCEDRCRVSPKCTGWEHRGVDGSCRIHFGDVDGIRQVPNGIEEEVVCYTSGSVVNNCVGGRDFKDATPAPTIALTNHPTASNDNEVTPSHQANLFFDLMRALPSTSSNIRCFDELDPCSCSENPIVKCDSAGFIISVFFADSGFVGEFPEAQVQLLLNHPLVESISIIGDRALVPPGDASCVTVPACTFNQCNFEPRVVCLDDGSIAVPVGLGLFLLVIFLILGAIQFFWNEKKALLLLPLFLGILDYATDLAFAIPLLSTNNVRLQYLGLAALISIGLSIVVNLICTLLFVHQATRDQKFLHWANDSFMPFVVLCACGMIQTEALRLLGSKLGNKDSRFGRAFHAPITNQHHKQLMYLSLIGNYVEDLPMIVIVIAANQGFAWRAVAIASLFISILSLLVATVTKTVARILYWNTQDSEQNFGNIPVAEEESTPPQSPSDSQGAHQLHKRETSEGVQVESFTVVHVDSDTENPPVATVVQT